MDQSVKEQVEFNLIKEALEAKNKLISNIRLLKLGEISRKYKSDFDIAEKILKIDKEDVNILRYRSDLNMVERQRNDEIKLHKIQENIHK
jgi:hypothetical protein